MALSPIKSNGSRAVAAPRTIQPSKTYEFDLSTGEITGLIDGTDAIRQFITKALVTARSRFLIYDRGYGCEIEDLISQNLTDELLNDEIPRLIREALIYDERISDVTSFAINRQSDGVYVSFTVLTVDGQALDEGVTI